jgi:uridine phosphorylase
MYEPLKESELILDEQGRIYHLHLKPEELAPLVLTVGDPDRVALVSQYFDDIEVKRQHREFVTHTGYLGKQRISVISTGIGADNIDIVMNELDALVNIDFERRIIKPERRTLTVIRIGTAGSLQADIPVDSLVVSRFGLGLDNLLQFYRYHPDESSAALIEGIQKAVPSLPIIPYAASGDEALFQQLTSGDAHSGITVTCPGFYAPQHRCLRAAPQAPDFFSELSRYHYLKWRVANMEMETAAIFGLSHILQHRAGAVNGIVANRIRGDFTTQANRLIKKTIEYTLERVAGWSR